MTHLDKRDTRPATADQQTPENVVGLYRHAFEAFGSRALWNIKEFDQPTVSQVQAITRQLRTEGNMSARRLAEQIEKAALADL